ncbi:DUF2793 domain-containing protein [Novosphingobium mangrovi (ex Hu et al. 2023)]|uniref:DUF2793 domain-containing protein n=1 Tax=Novosphingobium mangrovi (ex Hu et al. 2023) TaxID=2930094 RepID=A0ABT0AD29_9SPHN|nr:DUF2793 domain-containing protein [Novosphingobium mangrovi (ex Hu et al. 2023)]MCJ1961097.1 DUF2793 domain-containing protein [Novosphingobium mangrovi (ex Hu et al. 2023)]
MTDSVTFDATSPRYTLPLLFQGQAQKEFFINEALFRLDALLHIAIEGEAATPPASANDGQAWLVGAGATGEWAGHEEALACRQGGQWLFVPPQEGLRVYDIAAAQERFFQAGWKKTQSVQEPNGGAVVDIEARAAVTQLVTALQVLGMLPGA